MRIAYLEDDMAQAELVTHWLQEAGHNCIHLANGRDFMSLLRRDTFDILVLDWEVPDMNGYAVLEEVRASGNQTPVLFATQRDDESSIVGALSQGADDYMVKPTKQAELLARITALGRRAGVAEMDEEKALTVGPWVVDRARRQILLDEDPVKLTDKDYELASYLFQNVGKLMSRAHLLEKVWGIMTPIESRTVDVHISRIRRSLHIRPERGYRIKTVYQHGYRLEPVEE
ncbi:MAG: DNA-binding response regulator [Alcanivoracaceae bacterium]|uniref:response regulator transcription factor n=1 Tax=Alcanivorax sp. MD8A TaxID=1177157 RepID=UPI000C476F64|nr:response regulator transcription factor [Alcanivorax sp. MD8A]MAX54821.1 DNA-binding response regulator [Alcanivoracaceae bacterium]MCG8437038.1 response regulator transcription factor [Pseudomonadales bacterium]